MQQNTYLIITPCHTNQGTNNSPLMYVYELNDSLKYPTAHFNIRQYISFTSSNTRSWDHLKLEQHLHALHHHFYFNPIARLWNYLPAINLTLPAHIIRQKIKLHLWEQFNANSSIQIRHGPSICCVHATDAQDYLHQRTSTIFTWFWVLAQDVSIPATCMHK